MLAGREPLKPCFREPISEIFEAAELLLSAAQAHLAGNHKLAGDCILRADIPAISDWTDSIWGKVTEEVHGFVHVPDCPPLLKKEDRPKPRMPTASTKQAVIMRDGFHCRFCGIPVIRSETRKRIRGAYPKQARWGPKNADQHTALQCLWLQYDHLLPNQRGGTSELDNIVITCGPCNFGRMERTIQEARLMNPLERPLRATWVRHEDWGGLEHMFK